MKILYLDPFSGISGNMLIGALLDLGVPFDYLKNIWEQLELGNYELIFEQVEKCGIKATHFDVKLDEHKHFLPFHHHVHRNLQDISDIISKSKLSEEIKASALRAFTALAEAEGKVHGKPINEIHFHEVGAVDTIIDIVGAIAGLAYLGVERVYFGRPSTGYGFVKCAHGLMPIPAPATAELLRDIPCRRGEVAKELVTPTGAVLVKILGKFLEDLPENLTATKIGYGAGTWDLDIPNVLRAYLGEVAEEAETLTILECNLDDLDNRIYPYVMEKALEKGALDVWQTPIIMKKGRGAFTLSLLCREEKIAGLTALLFTETTTLGVRSYKVKRETLERSFETVEVRGAKVRIKLGIFHGKIVNIQPELEDCKAIAAASGIALKDILQEAAAAGRSLLHE